MKESKNPDSDSIKGVEGTEDEQSEENPFEEDEAEDEVEEDEEEEEEEEIEVKVVKQRRCQRRKKVRQICFDFEDDFGEEGEEGGEQPEEEDEDEEGEEEEGELEDEVSSGSSVFSAISFEWENEIYEFEELCDPGNIGSVYRRYYSEPNLIDEIGANRYLHVCKVLSVTPIIRFLRALYTEEVDLSHRQLHSNSIRAICAALETNTIVRRLILRYNKFTREDCFYIARMLHYNEKITLMDLTGCRIGGPGIEEFVEHLARNEVLTDLNLSRCYIKDEGMRLLSNILMHSNSIENLDLSYNKLAEEAAEILGLTLKINKSIKNLNLLYNNLFEPAAMKLFFRGMTANDSVTHLNLAWNAMSGPDIGGQLGNFLRRNSTILYLDLSDNRFEGAAVLEIKKGLGRSRSLDTLKLGKNPMSPEDLDAVLSGAKNCSTLKVLDLQDLWVKKSFLKSLKKIQQDREIEVNIGGVFSNYEVFGPDYKAVILKRAQFEAMKPKKKKQRKDFGHLIWTLGEEPLTEEQFMTLVKKFKAKISKELFPELIKQFLIPKAALIDVVQMKTKYLSLFPDSTPPPPPKVKGKGKGKVEEQEPEPTLGPVEETPAPVTQIFTDSGEEWDDQELEDFEESEGEEGIEAYTSEEEENIIGEMILHETQEEEEDKIEETTESVPEGE